MAQQDQHGFDDQQDFDEFDNLVDDTSDDLLDGDFGEDMGGRKKRQTVFYIALFIMVAIGCGAAWFLFFRPADTVTPLPMPGSDTPVAESVTTPPSLDGMPNMAAPEASDVSNADEQALPPVADDAALPPAADEATPPVATEQPVTPPQAPVDGTLAEALPPPVDAAPSFDDNAQTDLPPALPAPTGQDVALQAPATPAQENAQQPQPAAASVETVAPVVAQQPAAVPAQQPAVSDEATQAMQQRIAQLEQNIQSLTQELQNVKTAAPQGTAPAAGVTPEQLKAVNDKMDRLTQQIDALDQRTTTFATELQNRANTTQVTEEPQVVQPVAAKPAPKPAPKKAAAPRPAPTSVGGWELRAAQPGVAWLGKKGASEMGRYAVGQNVQGLGTVQAVTQEGGRWIVRTTGGTLRQ